MTLESDAHRYRLAQVQKMLDLFKKANGRPVESAEELEQWLSSPAGKSATAYDRDRNGKIIPDL